MKALLAVDGSADIKKILTYLATYEDLLGKSPYYVMFSVSPVIPEFAAKAVGKETAQEYH